MQVSKSHRPWKGGRYGKQGTEPVAHEVAVQVPHREATIAKYIREQEAHDIALDKLSVKEYEDPFKKG